MIGKQLFHFGKHLFVPFYRNLEGYPAQCIHLIPQLDAKYSRISIQPLCQFPYLVKPGILPEIILQPFRYCFARLGSFIKTFIEFTINIIVIRSRVCLLLIVKIARILFADLYETVRVWILLYSYAGLSSPLSRQ